MAFVKQSVDTRSGIVVGASPRPVSRWQRPPASQYMATRQVKGRRRGGGGLGVVSTMVNGGLTYGSSVVPASSNLRLRWQPVGPARVPTAPIQIGPAQPVTTNPSQPWGSNPPQWGGNPSPDGFPVAGGSQYGYSSESTQSGPGWSSTYGSSSQYGPSSGGSNPNNPTSANNLALLTQQYYNNPSSLTQQQWQQLQAAGVISSTVPYSNASLVSPSGSASTSSAIDPATGIPYSEELSAATAAAATTTSTSSFVGTDPTTGATTIFGIDWYWIAGLAVVAYAFTGKRR